MFSILYRFISVVAVFSILLQKPFIVYERGVLYPCDTIDTLLNKFDLNDRKCEKIENNKNVFDVDFSHTLPLLNKEGNMLLVS